MNEFIPVKVNDGQHELLLPAHVASELHKTHMTQAELSVDGQEMKAQREVFGHDGHGSIHVERNDDSEAAIDWANATPPKYEGPLPKFGDSRDDLWDRLKGVPDLEKPEPASSDHDDSVNPANDGRTEELPAVANSEKYELKVPVPEKLQATFDKAKKAYVDLRVKRSGSSFSIRARKSKLRAAKAAYDAAHAAIGEHVAKDMLEHGKKTAEEVRMAGAAGTIWEDYFTTAEITRLQNESGKHRKFYDWWARQNGKFFTKQGFKGAIAKSAAFAVVTAPVAIPAGIAGAFVGVMALGPAVGGLIGLGVGRGVARGLAGAHIAKNTQTSVAREQNNDAFQANEARINALAADGAVIGAAESSAGSFEQGNQDSWRNKKRILGGVVVGAATAAGAAWLSHAIAGHTGGTRGRTGGNAKAGGHRPKIRGGVGHETPTTPRGIPLNPKDNRYPWIHMNEVLGNFGDAKGGANSTPAIKALVDRGKEYGIDFVGKGRGIARVTIDGQTFTDNAHINAAFDETLRRVLEDEAAKAVATK